MARLLVSLAAVAWRSVEAALETYSLKASFEAVQEDPSLFNQAVLPLDLATTPFISAIFGATVKAIRRVVSVYRFRELRRVESVSKRIDMVLKDSGLLENKSLTEIKALLNPEGGLSTNWKVEALGRGTHKGQGWVLRQYTPQGGPTGQVIRWHPGGGHHGKLPYWRVSGNTGRSPVIRSGGP